MEKYFLNITALIFFPMRVTTIYTFLSNSPYYIINILFIKIENDIKKFIITHRLYSYNWIRSLCKRKGKNDLFRLIS